MNITNVDKAIAVMERARTRDSVDMTEWQIPNSQGFMYDEEKFHACGNKACFAGHLAISPEWRSDGNSASFVGVPEEPTEHGRYYGASAVARWFEISPMIAWWLISGGSNFYPVLFAEVKADHVIDKLKELKELGEEEFIKKYAI